MSKENQEFIALVALDDGSGNIACRFEDTDKQVFEKYIPARIERGSAAGLGGSGMSANVWETEEGNRFTVRKNPLKPVSTLDPDYQLSEANRVLALHTMSKAGLGDVPCVVGCTMPAEQFYNKGDDHNPFDEERQKAKGRNLMKRITNVYGGIKPPRVLIVQAFPEGLPAFFWLAYGERHGERPKYTENQTTLIVDLGEFTADLALVGSGAEDEVLAYSTHEHGIHVMVERFRALLAREGIQDAKSIPTANLKNIIQCGYIGTDLETPEAIAARVDISHLVAEAAEYLNDLLLEDIRELTRGVQLTRIGFVGGGAYWLGGLARKTWKYPVDIPDEPELAIVRGVHLLMQNDQAALLKQARAKLAKETE